MTSPNFYIIHQNKDGASLRKVGWIGEQREEKFEVWGLAPGKLLGPSPLGRRSEKALLQGWIKSSSTCSTRFAGPNSHQTMNEEAKKLNLKSILKFPSHLYKYI